ncbi:Vacuolar protein sorting-associated protein 35 [Botryosphaeria dothidea]|uniref:Vacuolar protein sorting-associated protein 35 n=1 Tax=Botryosphaeria dothidea TaxID=55169 RepID=A0A8H4IUR7_9PEZI|nr:Vacuolar protein sorting-associated protein 35 [Botryosphaeria dothidea]
MLRWLIERLTCDTVKSFDLVFPNGTISRIESSEPDVFFALKEGLNRFGIVTAVEFLVHEQSLEVYKGGFVICDAINVDKVLNATASFDAENKDPRAQVITTLSGSAVGVTALVLFFYDGPEHHDSFAPFDDLEVAISTLRKQKFSDFVQSIPSRLVLNVRGAFHTGVTSSLTPTFLEAVKNETDSLGKAMAMHSGTVMSIDVEPFSHTFGKMAADSAFPHARSPLPLFLYFAWLSEDDDEFWYEAMRTSAEPFKNVAIAEGICLDEFTMYPNYALSNTTAEELYGIENAARLRSIKSKVDPNGIMDLAGGFLL